MNAARTGKHLVVSEAHVRTVDDGEPPEPVVARRAELLPEERAVGSDDPRAQAEAILEESVDRRENPDPDASTQSGRRSSADTA